MSESAVLKRLPELVKELKEVHCLYHDETKSVGEAISYLLVLEDILKDADDRIASGQ